ncbi:MAG TPA: DUF4229 domain-containing protein [Marmoricola sp.]
MKDFWIYTGLRIGLFVACYAVFAGASVLISGNAGDANFLWPFVAAVLVSAVLSYKVLQTPRNRFARRVQDRAERATAKFEAMKSHED